MKSSKLEGTLPVEMLSRSRLFTEETTNPTMTTEDETTEVTGFLSTSETVSEETTTDSSSTEATSAIYSTDITSDVSTSLDTTDSTTVEFSSTTPTTSIITGLLKATFLQHVKQERYQTVQRLKPPF